jgi:phosphatidylglycerol---prolipoprotein diacylglyceryl transferase
VVAFRPIYLQLGHVGADLHMLFETLAYILGFQIYRRLRQIFGDPISLDNRWWIIATAAVGALLGSKMLGGMEQTREIVREWRSPAYLISGKSIVGGLVGGWIAVEWIKRRLGITVSTGDLFAVPLALGIAVERVGCFMAGLPDQTYGIATTLPWGGRFWRRSIASPYTSVTGFPLNSASTPRASTRIDGFFSTFLYHCVFEPCTGRR